MLQHITSDNFGEMLSRFTTPELEGMIEKYPYFRQAHLLLAKKYQLAKDPRFDQQLQLAALYTQDRELLFTIFNKQEVETSLIPEVTQPVIQSSPAFVPPVEEVKTEIEPVVEERQQPIIEEVKEEPEFVAPIVVERETGQPTALKEEQLATEEAKEELQNAAPVISDSEINTVVEIREEVAVEESKEELQFVTPVVTESTIDAPVEIQEEVIAEEPKETEPFSYSEEHTFAEWLKEFGKINLPTDIAEETVAELTPEKQDEELDKIITASVPVNVLHDLVQEETHYSKGLDKFIEEQIEKHRHTEHSKPVSENDIDPSMITETLAKLYVGQKKYARALKAYEILSQKFPDKKVTYTERMEYIRNLM